MKYWRADEAGESRFGKYPNTENDRESPRGRFSFASTIATLFPDNR